MRLAHRQRRRRLLRLRDGGDPRVFFRCERQTRLVEVLGEVRQFLVRDLALALRGRRRFALERLQARRMRLVDFLKLLLYDVLEIFYILRRVSRKWGEKGNRTHFETTLISYYLTVSSISSFSAFSAAT